MPFHRFFSEWEKELCRFHEFITFVHLICSFCRTCNIPLTLLKIGQCWNVRRRHSAEFHQQIMTVWLSPFKSVLQTLRTGCFIVWEQTEALLPLILTCILPSNLCLSWLRLQHTGHLDSMGSWILACILPSNLCLPWLRLQHPVHLDSMGSWILAWPWACHKRVI